MQMPAPALAKCTGKNIYILKGSRLVIKHGINVKIQHVFRCLGFLF